MSRKCLFSVDDLCQDTIRRSKKKKTWRSRTSLSDGLVSVWNVQCEWRQYNTVETFFLFRFAFLSLTLEGVERIKTEKMATSKSKQSRERFQVKWLSFSINENTPSSGLTSQETAKCRHLSFQNIV